MNSSDPRSLNETLNIASLSDRDLNFEYLAIIQWLNRCSPIASGVSLTDSQRSIATALSRVEDEMYRRVVRLRRAPALASSQQASDIERQRRWENFAQRARAHNYYPIFSPENHNLIGYMEIRGYVNTGFLGMGIHRWVPTLVTVYGLDGTRLWMNEGGLERPIVDPVSIMVGAAIKGGVPTVSQFALRLMRGTATNFLSSDFLRTLRSETSIVIIPNGVLRHLQQIANFR